MTVTSRLLALSLLVLVAGCAVGPDPNARLDLKLPATYAEGGTTPTGKVATRAFWGEYHDPLLNSLIVRGLKQNLDEAAARERIRAAAADLRGTDILGAACSAFSAPLAPLRSGRLASLGRGPASRPCG